MTTVLGKQVVKTWSSVTDTYELQQGDYINVKVKHEVEIHEDMTVPSSAAAWERTAAKALWNKILDEEGKDPLYVKVSSSNWKTWSSAPSMGFYSTGIVETEYQFGVEHASPIALSVAVGWSVVVLAGIVALILTSPYWGPLLWRAAGYEAGEVPPTVSIFEGAGGQLILIIGLIAVALILPSIFKGGKK